MSDHDHPTNPAVRLVDGAFYGNDPHPHLQWLRENAREESVEVGVSRPEIGTVVCIPERPNLHRRS